MRPVSGMSEPSQRIERREERLVVRKVPELRGRVHVEKRVTEEPRTIEVEVDRHEMTIDRRTVDRPLAPDEPTVQTRDEQTVLLVTEERLEVRKVPWVVEEIRLGRHTATERRRVSDTIRRETFDISTDGDVDLEPSESRGD